MRQVETITNTKIQETLISNITEVGNIKNNENNEFMDFQIIE